MYPVPFSLERAAQIFPLILLVQSPSVGIDVSCIVGLDLTLIDLVSFQNSKATVIQTWSGTQEAKAGRSQGQGVPGL